MADTPSLSDARFFRLAEECYLVRGASGGAVYNLLTGEVFGLSGDCTELLTQCERNETIPAAVQRAGMDGQAALAALSQLVECGLGRFQKTVRYVEKYRAGSAWLQDPFYRDPPAIHSAFVELTNACNLHCRPCTESPAGAWRQRACYGCSRGRSPEGGRPDLNFVTDILEQLARLETQTVIFTGGNPLMLDRRLLEEITDHCRRLGLDRLLLIANGTSGNGTLESLLERGVHIAFQAFGDDQITHDAFTGVPGSFVRLTTSLALARDSGVPFSVVVLLSGPLLQRAVRAVEFFQTLGAEAVLIDRMTADPCGGEGEVFEGPPTPQFIPCTKLNEFFEHRDHHPCLNHKLAVTANGKLVPCPGLPDEIAADLHVENLASVFQLRRLDRYWNLTKDAVAGCRHCEFRYACFDCRAVAKAVSGCLQGRTPCRFRPEQGTWI
jgi:radical SAM protein with 4Fe4S-binding SPASM domain